MSIFKKRQMIDTIKLIYRKLLRTNDKWFIKSNDKYMVELFRVIINTVNVTERQTGKKTQGRWSMKENRVQVYFTNRKCFFFLELNYCFLFCMNQSVRSTYSPIAFFLLENLLKREKKKFFFLVFSLV